MSFIAVENAVVGATVRKNYTTATPDEAASWPASNSALETLGAVWRTTTTRASALYRLASTRLVGAFHGLGHNLGRGATWRLAVGDATHPAVRPAVLTDGVDDKIVATTIPGVADATLLIRIRAIPQGIGNQTANAVIVAVGNSVGNGQRFRVHWRFAGAGTPFAIQAQINNWSTAVTIFPVVYPTGQWMDIALAYLDSTQTFELYIDGVSQGTATASAVWPNNGAERISIGVNNAGTAEWGNVEVVACHYYGARLAAADIAAWDAALVTGSETGLICALDFLEGTGSTVADATGNANATITGATWITGGRVNPSAAYSVERSVWGPWSAHGAFDLAPGGGLVSDTGQLGVVPRSLTYRFWFVWQLNDPGGIIGFVGGAVTTAAIRISTTTDGEIVATSFRGGTFTVTSTVGGYNDGQPHFCRATLNGRTATLTLYLAEPGAAEVSQGTPATTGAFAAVGDCRVALGTGGGAGTVATVQVAALAVFSEVVLEAEDPPAKDPPPWARQAYAILGLDGDAVDAVDVARTYTVGGTYSTIYVDGSVVDALEAADPRLSDAGADPFERYPRRLLADFGADLEISEIFVERCDADNSSGYLELATAYAPATIRLARGFEITGRRHGLEMPAATRSKTGAASLADTYAADAFSGTLTLASGRMGSTVPTPSLDTIRARLHARPRDRLVAVWQDEDVASHRLVETVVVGLLEGETAADAVGDVHDAITVNVKGVV